MLQELQGDETYQIPLEIRLGDYLIEALTKSGIGSIEGLTEERLKELRPTILEGLKDLCFSSKKQTQYRVEDIYLQEKVLRLYVNFNPEHPGFLMGSGPMTLSAHLNDVGHKIQVKYFDRALAPDFFDVLSGSVFQY